MPKKLLIEFNGKIASIDEHCSNLGISVSSVYERRRKTGDSLEACLLYYEEKIKNKLIEFNGKVASLRQHCIDLGVSLGTLYARKRRTGESDLECLNHYQHCGVIAHEYLVYFNGKVASLSEHCRDLGVKLSTLYARKIRTNESYEECLNYYKENGVKKISKVFFNGKLACPKEHCKDLGISYNVLQLRMRKTKESVEDCLLYFQKHGVRQKKYRTKDSRLYQKWYNMMDRCYNPKNPSYHNYGGRGIKVCERWKNYENFEIDVLESFLKHVKEYGIKDTTLERDDYNGDYCPQNCTKPWITRLEQANNKSNNVMITENLNIKQFADKYNMSYESVYQRFVILGWSIEKILNTPVGQQSYKYYLSCNGGTMSLREHCNQNNYDYFSVVYYIKQYNLTPDQALAKYLAKRNKK